MTKNASRRKDGGAGSRAGDDAGKSPGNAADAGMSEGSFFFGLLLLVVAVIVTGVLVLNHIGGLSLPGCREGGACAQAAASRWGKLPGTQWPISFVGFAYFVGMTTAWLTSKGGLSPMLKNIARLGAAASVFYVIVLIVEGHACYYCIATHAANLLFWMLVERCRTSRAFVWRPVATTAVVALLASAALGAVESRSREVVRQQQEAELAESTKRIIEASSRPAEREEKEESTVTTVSTEAKPIEIERPWKGGFTGRYLRGPKEAPIRVVMFTDFQCKDCKRTEKDIEQMLRARNDVSVSIKHFPFCTDCNPHVNKSLHPNACWAARAAETAGILRGNEGFWEMHDWLFKHDGSFTNEDFPPALEQMGYDPQEFTNMMMSKTTLELVQKDVEEAVWLGLHYTPMIFINGVELKGVFAWNAVSRAVAEVAASNPPSAGPENDQPPPASVKLIADWQEGEFKYPGEDISAYPMGPQGALLHVVLWGDYQEPNCRNVDRRIRDFLAGSDDAQYVFRHFPVNQTCNPASQLTKHPLACRASQAAEAAGKLGGVDAYWAVHNWLMDNPDQWTDLTPEQFDHQLRKLAESIGLDPTALLLSMDGAEVAAAIKYDCDAGRALGAHSIPFIFVNGRHVPRYFHNGKVILEDIFQRALEEDPASIPPPKSFR